MKRCAVLYDVAGTPVLPRAGVLAISGASAGPAQDARI